MVSGNREDFHTTLILAEKKQSWAVVVLTLGTPTRWKIVTGMDDFDITINLAKKQRSCATVFLTLRTKALDRMNVCAWYASMC